MSGTRPPPMLVVMGVSGAGKSSLARALADRLGWGFVEGDDLHPPSNREKMAAGLPLDDTDRAPWLAGVLHALESHAAQGRPVVVACSALKRRYRDRLRAAGPAVRIVYVQAEPGLVEARLARRQGHFMPVSLLHSQFEALEEPGPDEQPIVVPAFAPQGAQLDAVLAQLSLSRPSHPP